MGIFDKILGTKDSDELTLDEREAFAAVLLVVMTSDGHISDDEAMGFQALVNRMRLFKSQTGQEFHAMMDKLLGILKRRGSDFLLEKGISFLPPTLYDTAFTVATDLVLSDGVVEAEEKDILYKLKDSLKINDQLAVKIVEVIRIKNRG